jgi:hypothetical protein
MPRVVLALLVVLAVIPPIAAADEPRLAVLIAAPWSGEMAMSQDVAAASLALRRRGFAAGEILVLDGEQTRDSILRFLALVRQRIAPWKSGDVFMAVAAHGAFTGAKAADARPALLLSAREPVADHLLFWDEIFNAVAVPAGVRVTLLPDA